MKGFNAVNEVGRKYCFGCGSNEDNLTVVDREDCILAVQKLNNRCLPKSNNRLKIEEGSELHNLIEEFVECFKNPL